MDAAMWVQVVHLGALHVLFASVGFLAASREAATPRLAASRRTQHHTGPLEAFSALWHFDEVHFMPCLCVPCLLAFCLDLQCPLALP